MTEATNPHSAPQPTGRPAEKPARMFICSACFPVHVEFIKSKDAEITRLRKALLQIADYSPSSTVQPVAIARHAMTTIPIAAIHPVPVPVPGVTVTQLDYDAVLSFLDELALNAQAGRRKPLNPIVIGGSAKLIAAAFRAALSAALRPKE